VNSVGMNSVLVSNVLITGWMCVERRGMPGRLAGLPCRLAGPHAGCARWRGRADWAGSAGPCGNGERGREKERLAGLGSASS
jgi:hypothetical protein